MKILKARKGQDIAEWAIAIALISVVTMAVLFMFAPKMNGLLEYINNSIFTVANKQ